MLHVLALTTKDQRQQNCHSKKCRNARGNSIDHFKERSFFYFLSVAIKLRLAGFWSSKRARKTDHHYTYSLLLPFRMFTSFPHMSYTGYSLSGAALSSMPCHMFMSPPLIYLRASWVPSDEATAERGLGSWVMSLSRPTRVSLCLGPILSRDPQT